MMARRVRYVDVVDRFGLEQDNDVGSTGHGLAFIQPFFGAKSWTRLTQNATYIRRQIASWT